MAAFVVACGAIYYVLSNDQDMEWLRTRIEATLNERSNGELTFRLEGAKISVGKEEGAHLLMSGLSVVDGKGRFVANSGEIKIVPSWLSLASSHISIRKVSMDGADIRVVSSTGSFFPDIDTQPEVLLADIFSEKDLTKPRPNPNRFETDVFKSVLNFEDGENGISDDLLLDDDELSNSANYNDLQSEDASENAAGPDTNNIEPSSEETGSEAAEDRKSVV